MNVHESEKIAGQFNILGYDVAENLLQADIIVFNTCCIRDTAEQKIIGNIGALKKLTKNYPEKIIAVLGCMTQQEGAAKLLKDKFPFIDIVLGTNDIAKLGELLSIKTIKCISVGDPTKEIQEKQPVYRTSYPNAWVNIIYGCDNFCSYCVVPYVRGGERSRAFSDIINEVRGLVDDGYGEVTLLGQNVNSYKYEAFIFADLLKALDEIEGKFRIRFMTSHPKDMNAEIVKIIAASQKICKSIHLPVQSGSDRILKLMNRKYDREYYLKQTELIRNFIPGAEITTDIMVGFPGEMDKDFADTLDLVSKVRFSSAFTFIYSSRKGTTASKMPDIDASIKKERIMELIKIQNKITIEDSKKYIDNIYEILIEEKSADYYRGRTDCGRVVVFKADGIKRVGEFADVKILQAKTTSLSGILI